MISFLNFLTYLIRSLTKIGIDEDDVADPVANDIVEEPVEDDVEEPAEDVEKAGELDSEEPAEPQISRRQAEIIKLRRERQEAEARYDQVRRELEVARSHPVSRQDPTVEDQLRQQEDEVLNNPHAEPWQKYAVRANREARTATMNSQAALREARDLSDKAEFQQRYAQSQPKTFSTYAPRVEARLKEMRALGHDAPRAEVYAYLLGKDMAEGKLKSSVNKSSESKTAGVKRSSTPNARSDVRSSDSGRLTEAEKRIKRLENVRI